MKQQQQMKYRVYKDDILVDKLFNSQKELLEFLNIPSINYLYRYKILPGKIDEVKKKSIYSKEIADKLKHYKIIKMKNNEVEDKQNKQDKKV
jgi:hypothetical protein